MDEANRIKELEHEVAMLKSRIEAAELAKRAAEGHATMMRTACDYAEAHRAGMLRTLSDTYRTIDDFVELVSGAAPLAWAANQDMEGAGAWEKQAASLLRRTSEPSEADILERTLSAVLTCIPKCGAPDPSNVPGETRPCSEHALYRVALKLGAETKQLTCGCLRHSRAYAEDQNRANNTESFIVEARPELQIVATAKDLLHRRGIARHGTK